MGCAGDGRIVTMVSIVVTVLTVVYSWERGERRGRGFERG